jgi:hypothetical protein
VPLQNRVTPYGDLIREGRGTMFGNRGSLHDAQRTIVRRANGTRWICCALEFKGRHRIPMMQPGRYTELFFLDEVTALAAGHRPCAECRRADYDLFRAAWAQSSGAARPSAVDMDAVLDPERQPGASRSRLATTALPDGTFVDIAGTAHLLLRGRLLEWTPDGYANAAAPPSGSFEVITPPTMVAVIAAGFTPQVHPSAGQLSSS